MIIDIFSSFDPFINVSYQKYPILFWTLILSALLLRQSNFWISPPKFFWIYSIIIEVINRQRKRTQRHHMKGLTSILCALFIMIIMINFMGLLPYTFSYSRHLIFTLPLGLTIWFSLILSGALYAPKTFTAGLLPGGAPDWLNPFLVIVETIRIIARPITLSFRLAANITAGHIILGLVGIYTSAAIINTSLSMIPLLLTQTGYVLFEVGICLIQAYIFCLLLSLYADEHPATH